MPYVFAFHKLSNGSDWFNYRPYGVAEIQAIIDPQGGSNTYLPVAVPSPFARFDLVKSAFRNIVHSPALNFLAKGGNTIVSKEDERLVSQCFDVGELFFNFKFLGGDGELIAWDKKSELDKLQMDTREHQKFSQILNLYLQQDAQSYNFNAQNRFYFIKYKHRVIGGISPITLFFSSGDDLSDISMSFGSGYKIFERNSYTPLYKRTSEFQIYIYTLFKLYPDLRTGLPDVYTYLTKSLNILKNLNYPLYDTLNTLSIEDIGNKYDILHIANEGDIVDVIGRQLYTRKHEVKGDKSDFLIGSAKFKGAKKPLVLQNNFTKANFRYIDGNWNPLTKVPYQDPDPLNLRKLPGLNVNYPYLTVSDFLEPYIMKMVYPVNNEKYFDGNFKIETATTNPEDDARGYILPLNRQFFKYFDIADLEKVHSDGKKYFELQLINGKAVKAVLRIPLELRPNEYITFERIYYPPVGGVDTLLQPDIKNNKGAIIDQQVGITIFPFVKFHPDLKAFYRLQLIDRNVIGFFKDKKYQLSFYNQSNNQVIDATKKARKRKEQVEPSTEYYTVRSNFEYIVIQNERCSGIIIPKFPEPATGANEFTFAVDFGTTNTHIEYKTGTQAPTPFTITINDSQIAHYFHPDKTPEGFYGTGANAIKELINMEFVPRTIGGGGNEFKYPIRTAISNEGGLNANDNTFSLADFNIPFAYEKRALQKQAIETGLKWSKMDALSTKRIHAFLEQLAMHMRIKVLMNNGSLTNTRLVWFYPSSMRENRRNQLNALWQQLWQQYFGNNNITYLCEALAPFYYYKRAGKIVGGNINAAVSIDIGGGTTDCVIHRNESPQVFTSFTFAANSIFSSGFGLLDAVDSDPLANRYKDLIAERLKQKGYETLFVAMNDILIKNKINDIHNFFFSLENNPLTKDNSDLSYNKILSDDENTKIVFLFFYSAIVYHISKILKFKELGLPRDFVFSGTAAKMLYIISNNTQTLANFTKLILQKVIGSNYTTNSPFSITIAETPKELTCKGGLSITDADINGHDIDEIQLSLQPIPSSITSPENYSDIDHAIQNAVIDEVKQFINLFLSIHNDFSFIGKFGISQKSIDKFKEVIFQDLHAYLLNGINHNKQLDNIENPETALPETLFFYPIKGAIHNLLNHLCTLPL